MPLRSVYFFVGFFITGLLAAQLAAAENSLTTGPLEWATRMARSEMTRRGPNPKANWEYAQTVLSLAMMELGDKTNQTDIALYGKNLVAPCVNADGSIRGYDPKILSLDMVAPARAVMVIYNQTKEDCYQKAAALIWKQLSDQPKTSEGGFWHKQRYPYQLWLDSAYMSGPFAAMYAKTFSEPKGYALVVNELTLIDKHMFDDTTGLYYHGWDEKHAQDWADKETGTSPSFWSRGIGWYGMALLDVRDYFPAHDPRVRTLNSILQKVADAIERYQDHKSGLWRQVTDQGPREGNYLEASASAMFVYTLAKGINQGYLSRERYLPVAQRGFNGLIKLLVKTEPNGTIDLTQICLSAGLGYGRDGTYAYYLKEPIVENDPKGVGPFIMACVQMQQLQSGAH